MSYLEVKPNSENIPQSVLDESHRLMKLLFGPSVEEFGATVSESIRKRQYNNHNKIFTKTEDLLHNQSIKPQKVSLKVLAPLIELSSYEEEETLQDKWSYLIAHALVETSDIVFHQNCISILNKISSQDAKLLDILYEKLTIRREEKFNTRYKMNLILQQDKNITAPEHLNLESFVFGVVKTAKELGSENKHFEFSISNLIALGLLKWETDVEINAEKSSEDPEDKDIDVDVNVYNNDYFIFTSLGEKFVRVCKEI